MKNKIEALQLKAAKLTRETHALGIPVMIVFEGVPASGKTRLTNDLLLTLDAKYTQFIATKTPSEHDLRFQFLQNFWNTLPAKGHINIYFRSWYAHYIDYKIHEIKKSTFKVYDKLKNEIYEFETMLRNDNHEIIKFYIQINEEKRQEHIAQMKDNPLTHWKAQEYEQVIPIVTYQEEFQHLLDKEWEVIDYTRREHAIQQMYEHLIERLEKAIKHYHQREEKKEGDFTPDFETDMFNVDIQKVKKRDYDELVLSLQLRLRELQFALYERKIPLILVYEGMDAAGKGGNIKRIREYLDPTGYEVNAISAPTDVELNHHYLWRFAKDMPKSGHIEIFDRSWYGRVLVERVEGFASHDEWTRAYDEINAFEEMWVNEGAILLKFFLTLDKEEQLKRFKDREEDVNKQWKITDEDWRNRDKWDLYLEASHDMIQKTNQPHAPWLIVPADYKKSARIEVLKYVIQKCEERLWGVKRY
ncbi:phosphate--AMP phosphotransferase [Staphylococcus chromogenes]|uniref:phosphate--AMP phosphotransferase n=1 Tax=Staphylococcus chromogenes TaxID=46126 RepID=UPI000D19F21E|nr:phosphate--AMP phosphotransferase [Staphylococcus chromogenes]PTG22892.1 phosphate--AMP phosphotransferase [Staphylococcus chromogenes]PTG96266.1 phosphate--AMP phosphotransferase [Staphylococcus chromogenes]